MVRLLPMARNPTESRVGCLDDWAAD